MPSIGSVLLVAPVAACFHAAAAAAAAAVAPPAAVYVSKPTCCHACHALRAERPGGWAAGRERGIRPAHPPRVRLQLAFRWAGLCCGWQAQPAVPSCLFAVVNRCAGNAQSACMLPKTPSHACIRLLAACTLPETSPRAFFLLLPPGRYDSDHPRVKGDVGMAGVAVDSVEDMKAS